MTDEKVRLPRSSYEELCKIIKAYGQLETPASLSEISALSAIGSTKISANNSFLSYVQIVEGGNRKIATTMGRTLATALDHELRDKVASAWRNIIENNEFLNKMALAVRIRRGMDISTLVSHIAYNAGERKSGAALTGARAVVDILRASELIKEEDGKVVPGIPSSLLYEEGPLRPEIDQKETLTKRLSDMGDIRIESMARQGVTVNIDVQIQTTPADLDDLSIKLKAFLRKLREPEKNVEDESKED
jgi:hypothetical protein